MARTESPNPEHPHLDSYDADRLVGAFVEDQREAVDAVLRARNAIAAAIDAAVPRVRGGGRLIYVGAGTSGRLGLMDSVELYPTFSWPRERCVALLAGGERAAFESIEGAEDDQAAGAADMRAAGPGPNDVVIALSAAGAAPYVLGALRTARAAGALTVGIANNPDVPLTGEAEIGITLDTGAEVISGSTRLKAGTAQKIALNTLSSAIMVRLDKVYGNLMVDMRPTNAKLVRRAVALTVLATGTDEATARRMLEACEFQVKVAILAISRALDVAEARARLAAAHGSLRAALAA